MSKVAANYIRLTKQRSNILDFRRSKGEGRIRFRISSLRLLFQFPISRLNYGSGIFFRTHIVQCGFVDVPPERTRGRQPPFQQLAFIGGPKEMRGYFESRPRDKNQHP